MPGLFGMGGPATVSLAVVVLLVVVVLATSAGRDAVTALAGQVARWPGMIRAELHGAAPLGVDVVADDGTSCARARPSAGDTTPDIPVVTRGLPAVERPDRA